MSFSKWISRGLFPERLAYPNHKAKYHTSSFQGPTQDERIQWQKQNRSSVGTAVSARAPPKKKKKTMAKTKARRGSTRTKTVTATSRKRARSRSRRVVQGRMRRPFKAGKRPSYGLYTKYGALMRSELGGIIEQDKCIYVGHCCAARGKMIRIFCFAIMRKLAHKNGFQLTSMKDKIQVPNVAIGLSPGTLRYTYMEDADNTLLSATVVIAADSSWETVADQLASSWNGFSVNDTHPRLKEIFIVFQTEDATVHTLAPPARLFLDNCSVSFMLKSELTLQNRTLANSGGAAGDHDQATDVENNPIEGYSYTSNGTGFRRNHRNGFVAGLSPVFIGDDASGLINVDPDDTLFTSEEQDLLQRPPGTQMFKGVTKGARQRLGPGILRRSHLKASASMSVYSFISKIQGYLKSASDKDFLPIGQARMFAFEKMMHTTDATEPDMSIGFEINNFYACYIKEHASLITVDKDVL